MAGAVGVVGRPKRLFITASDVMAIFDCKKSCASDIVRKINKEAESRGQKAFPAGKANKYLFSEVYGIEVADIDKVIGDAKEG